MNKCKVKNVIIRFNKGEFILIQNLPHRVYVILYEVGLFLFKSFSKASRVEHGHKKKLGGLINNSI